MKVMNLEIIESNLYYEKHQDALIKLLNLYIQDPMGGGDVIDDQKKEIVIEGLKNHPASFIFFAKLGDEFAGLAICFLGYSTFLGANLINIHDFIVHPQFRKKGIGKKILFAIEKKAKELNCGKITLEVRKDNEKAMNLYKDTGFSDVNPPMHFWVKYLTIELT